MGRKPVNERASIGDASRIKEGTARTVFVSHATHEQQVEILEAGVELRPHDEMVIAEYEGPPELGPRGGNKSHVITYLRKRSKHADAVAKLTREIRKLEDRITWLKERIERAESFRGPAQDKMKKADARATDVRSELATLSKRAKVRRKKLEAELTIALRDSRRYEERVIEFNRQLKKLRSELEKKERELREKEPKLDREKELLEEETLREAEEGRESSAEGRKKGRLKGAKIWKSMSKAERREAKRKAAEKREEVATRRMEREERRKREAKELKAAEKKGKKKKVKWTVGTGPRKPREEEKPKKRKVTKKKKKSKRKKKRTSS